MNPVVTIDGPAGSGKSTVARHLAKRLKLPYIDTGSMYRAVADEAIRSTVDLEDVEALRGLAESLSFRFVYHGDDFQIWAKRDAEEWRRLGDEIRTPEVSMGASQVAKHAELRKVLVKKQQEIGALDGGVAEGRDAGTVIFPSAPVKFFLTARSEVRARRRWEELNRRAGQEVASFEEVLADVNQRDRQDADRKASPMKPAADAETVDTSEMNIEQVLESLFQKARQKLEFLHEKHSRI